MTSQDRDVFDVWYEDGEKPVRGKGPRKSTLDRKKHHSAKSGEKKKTKVKSQRSLRIAEHWVSLGLQTGESNVANPYWLADRIHEKVISSPDFRKVLSRKDGIEMTDRILEQMCQIYWDEYAEVATQPYPFDFLDTTVFNDVYYYARMFISAHDAAEQNIVVPQPTYYTDKVDKERVEEEEAEIRFQGFMRRVEDQDIDDRRPSGVPLRQQFEESRRKNARPSKRRNRR
jgi:hypothetical protein